MTICKGLTKIDRAMGIAINRQAEIVNDWNNAKTLDKPIEVTAKNTNSSNVDSITISAVNDDDRVKIMSSEKTEGVRFSRTYDEALNNPLSFKDKFTKTVADYTSQSIIIEHGHSSMQMQTETEYCLLRIFTIFMIKFLQKQNAVKNTR